MDKAKLLVTYLSVAAAALGLIVLDGCSTTYGTVYVSHPQVFTRERLVASRERELQFLSKSLDAPVTSTYQGAIDTRELSAFQNSLAATVSPTAGSGTTAATPQTMSDASSLMPTGTGSMGTASNIGLSSEDQFKDALAYRDTVNDAIREKELDDTHDRNGKTLYTLKFDTALIPGDNSTQPALIKFIIRCPSLSDANYSDIYNRWLIQLGTRLDEDENAMDMRFYQGKISAADDDLIQYLGQGLSEFCAQAKVKVQDLKEVQKIFEYGTNAVKKAADLMLETPVQRFKDIQISVTNADAADRDLLFTGMELALVDKYDRDFAGLALIAYNFDTYGTNDTVGTKEVVAYNPGCDANHFWWSQSEWKNGRPSDGLVQFRNVLSNWGDGAYVDSIDPQMYAQNISDVSSKVKLQELALAVNAAIGKPVSLSDNMKWTHETETLLQSIKRKPLAMGFGNGTNFDWFLGPAFEIKDGVANFVQAPTRQSFSVSIVMPAWWTEVKLAAIQSWIDTDGKEIQSTNLPSMDVTLPGDMDALVSTVLYRKAHLAPKIYFVKQNLQVSTNEQTLLIQGRELWRNPAVFLNSTRANAVDLLPDMKGVLAHFASISAVDVGKADLTVVTSQGSDSLPNAVTIVLPSIVTNPPAASAKLTNSFAVNSSLATPTYTPQPLAFALTSMPSAFAGFSINVYIGDGPGKWQNLGDSDYKMDSNRVSISIPIAITNAPIPVSPTTYKIDLGLRLLPSSTPVSLFGGSNQPTFIYFPTKDQEKPVISSVSLDYSSNAPPPPPIILNPASNVVKTNLYQAYPGLQTSLSAGTTVLVLTESATKKQSTGLMLQDAAGTGWTVSTTGSTTASLPSATYDGMGLQYVFPNNVTNIIPCTGGPVTVKGH